MHPPYRPNLLERAMTWGPFVASAALVALGVQLAVRSPRLSLVLLALAALAFVPQFRARRRVRRLLESGDVDAMLGAWQPALADIPERDTMAPLITATALVSNGMVERARSMLSRAHKGPAWDAALEHRLFIEVLADAFEGDRGRALENAQRLAELPLPHASPFVRARVSLLRSAAGALARAFAHTADKADLGVLRSAARRNPLVHWAMRYAAAVACIDRGRPDRARKLLEGAPEWPEASVFQAFHAELVQHASV
jgi:hypothetical protein